MPHTLTTAQIVEHAAGMLAQRRQTAQRYLAQAALETGSTRNLDRARVLGEVWTMANLQAGAMAALCLLAGDRQAEQLIEADIEATAQAMRHAGMECRVLSLPVDSQPSVRAAMQRAAEEVPA